MFDQITPPISGSLFAVVAGYVALSLVVTGPTIGRRVIERDGWMPRCEKAIVQSVRQKTPELKILPQIPDCKKIMGVFAGEEGKTLCGIFGSLLENPLAGQIQNQNQKLIEAHNNRVANAAANASSQCECSVNVVLEERVSWAMFAGSLRAVKMSEIRNLDARLRAALSSPVCAGTFEGRFQ